MKTITTLTFTKRDLVIRGAYRMALIDYNGAKYYNDVAKMKQARTRMRRAASRMMKRLDIALDGYAFVDPKK